MKNNFTFLLLLLVVGSFSALSPLQLKAQEDIPFFPTDFPPQEFAERRAKVFGSIGENGVAILQGAPSPAGYVHFRQSNEFYYLTQNENNLFLFKPIRLSYNLTL
jgi:hypothetical protein